MLPGLNWHKSKIKKTGPSPRPTSRPQQPEALLRVWVMLPRHRLLRSGTFGCPTVIATGRRKPQSRAGLTNLRKGSHNRLRYLRTLRVMLAVYFHVKIQFWFLKALI